MTSSKNRFGLGLFLIATLIAVFAGYLRLEAVKRLPVDFDELVYLPVAFRYKEMMAKGDWKQILQFQRNREHPPFNKLLFASDLLVRDASKPKWKSLDVRMPIPPEDQPAFFGPRRISAIGGTLQVLLIALVHPVAGLLLALDTYHIKYSSQVYLEGVPGFFAVLAVFLFELGLPKKSSDGNLDVTPRWKLLVLSAIALGLSTAGKYLYGIVGVVLIAFLILRTRSLRSVLLFSLISIYVFVLADPFLWPNPPVRLWDSLTFHWRYAHSEHVVSSARPWYSPIGHLLKSLPTKWHPDVFYTGFVDVLILPFSLIGLPRAWRERPIWVVWAGFGLFVLLLWPTKWTQYTLIILPPLSVCAGLGIEQIGRMLWNKVRRARFVAACGASGLRLLNDMRSGFELPFAVGSSAIQMNAEYLIQCLFNFRTLGQT